MSLCEAAETGDVEASIVLLQYVEPKNCKQCTANRFVYHYHHRIGMQTYTNAHTQVHIHKYTENHTHATVHCCTHIHVYTHTHTPQQVRSLLASGIKPDAETDDVSVFWCRLD